MTAEQSVPTPGRFDLLRSRSFRLLWLGEGVSLLGDQFYFVAVPWLVLQLTGSALAMGTFFALAGVPRATFMLVGGAITDRFSPRRVMLASYLFRLVLVSALAVVVSLSIAQLWMIDGIAVLFGFADAFYFPAQQAIVPLAVDPEHLAAGNMLTQSTAQISFLLGPAAAGALIALAGSQGTHPASGGIAVALAIDALTFLIAALLLGSARIRRVRAVVAQRGAGVLAAIHEGLKYVWADPQLRIFLAIAAATNVLTIGPMNVGIPLLAHDRFPEGAAAFGIIESAFAGGTLAGTVLGGLLPRPSPTRLGPSILGAAAALGFGVAVLGLAPITAMAAADAAVMGLANGYINIMFITWMQRRTPEAMMGRMMSLLMIASLGLSPLSNAVAGALAGLNLTALLLAGGLAMASVSLLAILHPATRSMETAVALK